MRAVPRLCELYPGICLTTEEKARKNLSQGSRRVPAGTMKTEYAEQNVHKNTQFTKIKQKHAKRNILALLTLLHFLYPYLALIPDQHITV